MKLLSVHYYNTRLLHFFGSAAEQINSAMRLYNKSETFASDTQQSKTCFKHCMFLTRLTQIMMKCTSSNVDENCVNNSSVLILQQRDPNCTNPFDVLVRVIIMTTSILSLFLDPLILSVLLLSSKYSE